MSDRKTPSEDHKAQPDRDDGASGGGGREPIQKDELSSRFSGAGAGRAAALAFQRRIDRLHLAFGDRDLAFPAAAENARHRNAEHEDTDGVARHSLALLLRYRGEVGLDFARFKARP